MNAQRSEQPKEIMIGIGKRQSEESQQPENSRTYNGEELDGVHQDQLANRKRK
jgi:hypothetical protein